MMYLAMVLIEYDSQFPCFFEMSIFYLLEDNDMWLCIYIWYVIVHIYIYMWFINIDMSYIYISIRDLWQVIWR